MSVPLARVARQMDRQRDNDKTITLSIDLGCKNVFLMYHNCILIIKD